MEFREFVDPDPRMVSVDYDGNEFYGTAHNQGDDGTVRSELWFFQDRTTSNPDTPYPFQRITSLDRKFNEARSSFFSEGERREISIIADNEELPVWEWEEYGIIPYPASYGAVFHNSGSSGEIEFRFEFRDTSGYEIAAPSSKLESVGSDEEIEVVFDILVPPGVEYEIIAEPR